MNVKRLAAVDMYGSRGTTRRKRIILGEFTSGLAATVALGTWLATEASSLGTRIFGVWLIGAGLNYAPLAVYAVLLSRPGALEAELAGVDAGQELRRYSVLQLWILVPLSLVAMTALGRSRHSTSYVEQVPAAITSRASPSLSGGRPEVHSDRQRGSHRDRKRRGLLQVPDDPRARKRSPPPR